MNYFLLTALSFLVGTTVGLTGIGGAALITPMLIVVFQVPPSVAVSSDIVAATLMKLVGGVEHWRQQTLDAQVVKWLALGSVPGSLLGVALLYWLRQTGRFNLDTLMMKLIGVAILSIALVSMGQLVAMTLWPKISPPQLPKIDLATAQGKAKSLIIGAVLGAVVGLTSVSSGSMFALAMIAFFQLDARKLVGSDLAQAAILLSFTAVGHLALGTVDWHLVIPIWIGSVPGVLVGTQLCRIAPQKILRFGIYLLLTMASWKLVAPLGG